MNPLLMNYSDQSHHWHHEEQQQILRKTLVNQSVSQSINQQTNQLNRKDGLTKFIHESLISPLQQVAYYKRVEALQSAFLRRLPSIGH